MAGVVAITETHGVKKKKKKKIYFWAKFVRV